MHFQGKSLYLILHLWVTPLHTYVFRKRLLDYKTSPIRAEPLRTGSPHHIRMAQFLLTRRGVTFTYRNTAVRHSETQRFRRGIKHVTLLWNCQGILTTDFTIMLMCTHPFTHSRGRTTQLKAIFPFNLIRESESSGMCMFAGT